MLENIALRPTPPLTEEEKACGQEAVRLRQVLHLEPEQTLAAGLKGLARRLKDSQSWRKEGQKS